MLSLFYFPISVLFFFGSSQAEVLQTTPVAWVSDLFQNTKRSLFCRVPRLPID